MNCPTCGKLAQRNRMPNSDGQTYNCLTAGCKTKEFRVCPCCKGPTRWSRVGPKGDLRVGSTCDDCHVKCMGVLATEPCNVSAAREAFLATDTRSIKDGA